MTDVQLMIREREDSKTLQARQRVRRQMRGGTVPSLDDQAQARGLVIREREDSIFSDAWTPLAILFVIIGFALDRNPAWLALGLTLLIIVGVSTWWKNRALDGVSYQRTFDRTNVFPGEPIEMTIKVTNEKPLPLTWLRFVDELPIAADMASVYAELAAETSGRYLLHNTFSMAGNESAERTVTLRFPQRGYHRVGPVNYRSGDIFTLFTVERLHDATEEIIIYPQIFPLTTLGLPAKEPFGDVKTRRSLFTDPIRTQGIRDYQPQDRFRDVHWKATARRGRLQTKIYEPSTGMTAAIFLNVATFARHWMGFEPDKLERAISVAGSVASYGFEQNWAVGLYANGSVPRSDQPIRVPPGRSPGQLNHVLEALAAVTEFATGSLELLMLRESPRLPWAATMVVVTAVVTDDLAVTLMRLKEAGRRVALISIDDAAPPPIPGVVTYHSPTNVDPIDPGLDEVGQASTELGSIPVPRPVNRATEAPA